MEMTFRKREKKPKTKQKEVEEKAAVWKASSCATKPWTANFSAFITATAERTGGCGCCKL